MGMNIPKIVILYTPGWWYRCVAYHTKSTSRVPSFERRGLIQCSVSWHPTNQLIPSISITHNGSGLVILCISFRHNGCIEGKCSRHPWGGRSVWRPIDDICPPISSLNSQPTLPHCTLLSGLHHLFSFV